ncbi:MAG: S-methyl-5-thioribose-1-phosphate isomerase [Candidatus Krumholzibacteriia bacterium]
MSDERTGQDGGAGAGRPADGDRPDGGGPGAGSRIELPFPFPVVSFRDGAVVLLDQTRLPGELVWRECRDIPTLCTGIRELAVRGAPAIGVAAAYGLVLAWSRAAAEGGTPGACLERLRREREALAATRPTAVNLFWALERLATAAERRVAAGDDAAAVTTALEREADAVLAEDLEVSRRLGLAGAALLPDDAVVLTHCNAGGLATGGYGTALGVVYAARELGKRVRVFADETRPLLQGGRLTALELASQGIDVTVIPDSAAATVLRQGKIDAVITGADRVAANGDTANKIGTYPLAVLAQRHGVPFYIAAPASTFDPDTPDGDAIPIEERDPQEVLTCLGAPLAPQGLEHVHGYNPAFDVTPAELIAAHVTEHGVLRPPYAESLRPVLEASRRARRGLG